MLRSEGFKKYIYIYFAMILDILFYLSDFILFYFFTLQIFIHLFGYVRSSLWHMGFF